MNGSDFYERVAELDRARATFATATVVARHAPVSSHLGDRAIVHADGRMQGFVGGSCSRDVVRRQAVSAMRSGEARLVQIRPGAALGADDNSPYGTVVVPMSCVSEGAVDVYVEPHLPARTLLVVGSTPVAEALANIAVFLDGYHVIRVLQADEPGDAVALRDLRDFLNGMDATGRAGLVAVVASQGHYDETALAALLDVDMPAYVGLLASRKRAADAFDRLAHRGISSDRLACVHNPAGIDIGARRPGDVAVSILAEIVSSVGASEARAVSPDELPDLPADHECCTHA